MGFLSPLFLLAGAALAVPLLLHLLQRHETRRISFPAVRYLLRTEQEHAKRIRLRQILLLVLRLATIVIVVLVGARLFIKGQGGAHEPTALAVILDNSLSSGMVRGDVRVLDELKARALETLDVATDDDRIWIIRAGEPWTVAEPLSPAAAIARVRETEVSEAAGDLVAALRRAEDLVSQAGLPEMEIQLLSDLQATSFMIGPAGAVVEPPEVPVVVLRPEGDSPSNRGLHSLLVGGGLAPVANQRTEFTVEVSGSSESGDTLAVRLLIDGRIRAASSAPVGGVAVLPGGPFPSGWITGFLEADRDGLLADDRIPFAFQVGPPPTVSVSGVPSLFLESGLEVLEEEGRIRRIQFGSADLRFAVDAEGLQQVEPGGSVVLLPPENATSLPAFNRRLAAAGVPWQLEATPMPTPLALAQSGIPIDLEGVEIRSRYRVVRQDGTGAPGEGRAHFANGDIWIASGVLEPFRYLLLGSPLTEEASDLPVSAAMIPLLQWVTGQWGATPDGGLGIEAGTPLSLPSSATAVLDPSGTQFPVDAARRFRATGQIGIYSVLAQDSVIDRVAVIPPVSESDLSTLDRDQLEQLLGSDAVLVNNPSRWSREVFRARRGPEPWRLLLVALLGVLLLESWVAAAGRGGTSKPRQTESREAHNSSSPEISASPAGTGS